jgi:hypothetical protein
MGRRRHKRRGELGMTHYSTIEVLYWSFDLHGHKKKYPTFNFIGPNVLIFSTPLLLPIV